MTATEIDVDKNQRNLKKNTLYVKNKLNYSRSVYDVEVSLEKYVERF